MGRPREDILKATIDPKAEFRLTLPCKLGSGSTSEYGLDVELLGESRGGK